MKPLQIDEQKAKKLFPSANAEFKEMLIDSFGKDFFSEKITDRVKTYEDACRVLSFHPAGIETGDDSPDELAYKKLKIIIQALNEGWVPDWSNSSEYKYYPWFKMTGSGLVYYFYVSWTTLTFAGSRLCFKNSDLAEYAGRQFQSLYNQFLNL